VSDRVRFLGLLSDEPLRDAYQAADLFVQPNGEVNGMTEGYGMVYLEAGAAGLAVIGGRSGGVVEAVTDGVTGILVTPFRASELAEKMDLLLADGELRKRLGEAGRDLAGQRGWDDTLRPVLELDAELRKKA
jgi:phosphatidyl-myo-inositol dimannoside synthase